MGNKTGSFDYLEHPVTLPGGEFGIQDSYVSKDGPLSGWESCWQSNQSLNTEEEKEIHERKKELELLKNRR